MLDGLTTDWFNWSYWYVFPCAVLVAIIANASGFSGAVLFQPIFNLVLKLPLHQSIATGIATEAIGMSSGACRYLLMRKVDLAAARAVLPWALAGVLLGLYVFVNAPRDVLRLLVGVVVASIALFQLYGAVHRDFGRADRASLTRLRSRRPVSVLAGAFSACTGTGVAEMHQPLLERAGGLATKRANATAIFVEAVADLVISSVNVSLGNLRPDVLVFSVSGVLIGAQLGAAWSPRLPDRVVKVAFALSVLGIGVMYAGTSLAHLAPGLVALGR